MHILKMMEMSYLLLWVKQEGINKLPSMYHVLMIANLCFSHIVSALNEELKVGAALERMATRKMKSHPLGIFGQCPACNASMGLVRVESYEMPVPALEGSDLPCPRCKTRLLIRNAKVYLFDEWAKSAREEGII